MRAPKRTLGASVLVLESLVVLFAGLAVRGLGALNGTRPTGGAELATCAAIAVACVLTAGMLRSRAGFVVGSVLQVAVLATGFWIPVMFFLGAVFAVLWFVALRVGTRIERERAAHAGDASSGV